MITSGFARIEFTTRPAGLDFEIGWKNQENSGSSIDRLRAKPFALDWLVQTAAAATRSEKQTATAADQLLYHLAPAIKHVGILGNNFQPRR